MRKRGVFSSRSAQVTIFIIIGLILLATIATVLYLKYAYVEKIAGEFELSQEPVTAYIQQCLIDVTEEAVLKAGQQGGYIYIDKLEEDELELAQLLPFNNELLFLANGKQQLPYWYYQLNDGFDRIAIPELEMSEIGDDSIQDQMERYITEQLPVCLNNFEGLSADVSYAGEYSISTEINDESIEVTAYLPITIEEGSTVTELDEFYIYIPVGLKKTYELAKQIANYELNTLFLEQTTRNLLAIYGQVDKRYLPPMAGGLTFGACSDRQYWFYTDVERNTKQMLAANIPYLQIANTQVSPITIGKNAESDDERRGLRQAVFDKLVHTISKDKYEGITTLFNYHTTYPMELIFGNNIGYGLIQPNVFEINVLFANFCMFDYSFLYNLKYPVLVTLTDSTTDINGNAFVFQFPIQVVVKNNYPRVRLNDVFANEYEIPEESDDPTWQCDPQQRISGESTINIKDPQDVLVENAVITFQCGPSYVYSFNENGTVESVVPFAKTCYMGTTDDAGQLTTRFPPCTGSGFITIQHEDYLEKSEATGDIIENEAFEKTVTLNKVYTKNIELQKYFVAPPSETNQEGIGIHLNEDGEITVCNLNMEPKELQSYESAVISLTKLDTENGALTTAPIIIFDPNEEQNTIDLAAGKYLVDIMLLREERYEGEMTIEANSQGVEVSTTTGTETITYPDEDVLIPQTFTGGASYHLEISESDLENSNTIVFSVFDEGPPKYVEQVSAPLMHREACSILQENVITPDFK